MEFEKIRTIICDILDVDENEVTLQTRISEDLGADSLDIYEAFLQMEDVFQVEIPADQLKNIQTVEDIRNVLKELKQG